MKISFLLDEHELKAFIDCAVAELVDADLLKAFKKNMAKAKQLILDGVRDHIVEILIPNPSFQFLLISRIKLNAHSHSHTFNKLEK